MVKFKQQDRLEEIYSSGILTSLWYNDVQLTEECLCKDFFQDVTHVERFLKNEGKTKQVNIHKFSYYPNDLLKNDHFCYYMRSSSIDLNKNIDEIKQFIYSINAYLAPNNVEVIIDTDENNRIVYKFKLSIKYLETYGLNSAIISLLRVIINPNSNFTSLRNISNLNTIMNKCKIGSENGQFSNDILYLYNGHNAIFDLGFFKKYDSIFDSLDLYIVHNYSGIQTLGHVYRYLNVKSFCNSDVINKIDEENNKIQTQSQIKASIA